MAQAQTQPQTHAQGSPVAAARAGPGRPPAASIKPGERTANAVKRLQYSLDRAASYINDGSTSFARRARLAAKAGVSKEKVLAGFGALEAAMKDARSVIDAAYMPSAPGAASKPKSRVSLEG